MFSLQDTLAEERGRSRKEESGEGMRIGKGREVGGGYRGEVGMGRSGNGKKRERIGSGKVRGGGVDRSQKEKCNFA